MIYNTQTIPGQPPSKSNGYKIINIAGHFSLGKTKAMKDYEEKFFNACTLRNYQINNRFKLTADLFFASDRPDLDNALKIILDSLQRCKAIKNDRLCAEIHARKFIDKENPRTEFIIETLTT